MLKNIAALLFDFDGTLADSERCHYLANLSAFRLFGHELDEQEYYLHWTSKGTGIAGEIERHGLRKLDRELVRRHKDALFSEYCRTGAIKLFPETPALLDLLARAPFPGAIVSNTAPEQVLAILMSNGIGKPPVPLIAGEENIRPKPHPDLLLRAAQRLGIPPAGCIIIEDTEKGVIAAQAAGMKCLLVPAPYLTAEVMAQADGIITRAELLAALRAVVTDG